MIDSEDYFIFSLPVDKAKSLKYYSVADYKQAGVVNVGSSNTIIAQPPVIMVRGAPSVFLPWTAMVRIFLEWETKK